MEDCSTELPLVRYCAPSKFDKAPTGTICRVIGDTTADSRLYIQISDQESPSWIEWGAFLATALHDLATHEEFMHHCLSLYLKAESKAAIVTIVLEK